MADEVVTMGDLSSMIGAGIQVQSSQRNQRISMVADDQFGRAWALEVEKETQEPTCLPMPAGWVDHLATPPKYIRVPRGKHGQRRLGEVHVDFATWIDEQIAEEKRWEDFIWKRAEARFADNLPRPEELESHPLLVKDAGPKPWPSSDVLIYVTENKDAKIAREILGLESELSVEAKVMLGIAKTKELLAAQDKAPKRYQEFLAWAIAKGKAKNMTQAAALWTERKTAKED